MERPEKSSARNKSITAKVSEEEYARLQEFASAQGQSMGELARDLLLRAMEHAPAEQTILAEILGLRMLYLNTVQILGAGRELTTDDLRKLIEKVDREKQRSPQERLGAGARKEIKQ